MPIGRLRASPSPLVLALAISLAPVARAAPNDAGRSSASDAPPASRGFQATLGTGFSLPMGDATGAPGDRLGRRYAWQWPLGLGLGGKVSDSVFIGGYLGFAFGAEGSDLDIEAACRDRDDNLQNDISCSAFSFQLGLEGRYSFAPSERWNPWLAYGAGFEASEQSIEDHPRRYRESQSATGFTVAKVSVGIDRRAKVGFGPYTEIAVGRFTRTRTEIGGAETHAGTIDHQAFHAWLTFGLRLVLLP